MTPTLATKIETDQAAAFAPLLEQIFAPKPRFDAAADRREDALNDARDIAAEIKERRGED